METWRVVGIASCGTLRAAASGAKAWRSCAAECSASGSATQSLSRAGRTIGVGWREILRGSGGSGGS